MEAQALAAQQRYPPEPPPTFPADTDLAADQLDLSEPPPILPILDNDVDARGLRAETNALSAEELSRLSVGHAKTLQSMDPSQLYTTAGLLVVVVGVLLLTVVRRKSAATSETKKSDAQGRSVMFTDSYEPFLG